ncbi:MAG: hypothetical protein AAGN35_02290 [Bacteroidota bacterium]
MSKTDPKKLNIIAYTKDDYSSSSKGATYPVYVNPASLDWQVSMNYEQVQTENAPMAEMTFKGAAPETLSIELWFDATGLLYKSNGKSVMEQVLDLKNLAISYQGSIHQPNFLMLVWGNFSFKGVMTSLNVTFSMIGPDGLPLRAKATASFSSSIAFSSAMASAKKSSPDMTHVQTVTAQTRLDNSCNEIYGDPRYYIQVARSNNLNQLRKLRPGSRISFPPLTNQPNS